MDLAFAGRSVEELGLAHEVSVDPHTGGVAVRVPLPVPGGRGGFGPALVLTHSSTGGNSPFGLGWSLSGLPVIGIDMRKATAPRRQCYVLDGRDELVPELVAEATARSFTRPGFDV